MHAPEYTARIKALIAAKDKTEGRLKNILYQFRNGWKVGADDIAEMKEQFAAVLEIVDPEKSARNAKLMELAREIVGGLETAIQREEAEIYLSTASASALIVVPGEEGLYPGKVITVHTTGETLTAETGSWIYES